MNLPKVEEVPDVLMSKVLISKENHKLQAPEKTMVFSRKNRKFLFSFCILSVLSSFFLL